MLEAKPTDKLEIIFNALDVKVNDDNFNSSFYVFPGWWKGGVTQSGTVANNILESGSISNNIGVMDIFYRQATIKTQSYDVKAIYKDEDFSVTEQAGYTKATGGTQHQYYIEPLLSTKGSDVGTTSYTYTGGANHPGFSFADPTVAANPSAWTVGGPWWNGNVAADPESDSEKYGQIDGELKLRSGPVKKILVGARYTDHSTSQNWYNISLTTLPFYTLANFGPTSTPGNFLSGLPNISSDMARHVIVNPSLLGQAVQGAPYGTTGMTMQQAVDSGQGFQPTQSFQVDELTSAVYAQANFEQNNFTGNLGVRYVTTKTTSKGYIANGTVVTPNNVDKSYNNFLPALNVAYPIFNDAIARFGASEVIARPNYADESSSVTLYDGIRTGVGGNPHLNPYKSDDLDAAVEWYFAKNSAIAANLFYKSISNYILKANGFESYFNQNQGVVTPYLIARSQNAGKAKSQGFSLSYQQTLAYGFGATANYTYVDASTASGGALPFASKNQVNLSPFFENRLFLVRLTYGWRSDYATNVDRGNYLYTKAYNELDAKAAYNVTKNLSFTVEVTNLLDETYYTYAKVPAKMFQSEYKNGRRIQAGIHWNF